MLARSSPDDKYTLVARLNGTLPESKEDWLKEHPGKSWEDDRDKLLPGREGGLEHGRQAGRQTQAAPPRQVPI